MIVRQAKSAAVPGWLDRFSGTLAVVAILGAIVLPGAHGLLGCPHAEHASVHAAHAHPGQDSALADSHRVDPSKQGRSRQEPESPDEHECAICLLIAATQVTGTGPFTAGLTLVAMAPVIDAPAASGLTERADSVHEPRASRGPPGANADS